MGLKSSKIKQKIIQASHKHALQKVAKSAHVPRQAKGTHKDDTSTPKKRQKLQKGSKRNPNASKRAPTIMKNPEKDRQVKTLFLKIENSCFTCMGAQFCSKNELPCKWNIVLENSKTCIFMKKWILPAWEHCFGPRILSKWAPMQVKQLIWKRNLS